MNILIILEVVVHVTIKLFTALFELFDTVSRNFARLLEFIVKKACIDYKQRIDEKGYYEKKRRVFEIIRTALAIVYPLLGLIYFFIWIFTDGDEKNQKKIFNANRVLIITLVIWGIINPSFCLGQTMDDIATNFLVNYLIAFKPIRTIFSCVYFNFMYANRDFFAQKPHDFCIKAESEKNRIEEYEEYGDR